MSAKSLFFIASLAILILSQSSDAYAGPYDGEWNGTAKVTDGRQCKPGRVTLTVLGEEALGRATFDRETQDIRGTVSADGTLGATIGFQHLTGKFIEDNFEGVFKRLDCAWTITLDRIKPPRR